MCSIPGQSLDFQYSNQKKKKKKSTTCIKKDEIKDPVCYN